MRFRTKPVEIEAIQYTGNWEDMLQHYDRIYNNTYLFVHEASGKLFVRTLEGDMHVSEGDWIIKGLKDELYSCKPDVFEQKYERIG